MRRVDSLSQRQRQRALSHLQRQRQHALRLNAGLFRQILEQPLVRVVVALLQSRCSRPLCRRQLPQKPPALELAAQIRAAQRLCQSAIRVLAIRKSVNPVSAIRQWLNRDLTLPCRVLAVPAQLSM